MAKKPDKSAPSGAGKGMRPGTLAGEHANEPESPPDPLAGKSDEEKRAALEAAKDADENTAEYRRGRAQPAGKRTVEEARVKAKKEARVLDVDPKAKAAALALIGKLSAADVKVREARQRRTAGGGTDAAHEAVLEARARRAELKKEYSDLYGKAPDSVQAAETEVAAGK